jgi:hypothetical protein
MLFDLQTQYSMTLLSLLTNLSRRKNLEDVTGREHPRGKIRALQDPVRNLLLSHLSSVLIRTACWGLLQAAFLAHKVNE